jgi:hypothetical protein
MDGTGDHHVKRSKPGSGQRSPVFPHMWKLDLEDKCTHKYIYHLTYIYIYKEREWESEYDHNSCSF